MEKNHNYGVLFDQVKLSIKARKSETPQKWRGLVLTFQRGTSNWDKRHYTDQSLFATVNTQLCVRGKIKPLKQNIR